MSYTIAGLQNRVKNSTAYSEELGLMLVANGEESPYVLSAQGEKIPCGITPPILAPTISDVSSGNLINGHYVVYSIVYASENSFPSVAPVIYSNPSPNSDPYEITGSGDRKLRITFPGIESSFVTHVYVYRTDGTHTTAELATVAANAGLLYYVEKIANTTGSLTVDDNILINVGNDVIQLINFATQTFRFIVWDGSYFWGFGNHAFVGRATWDIDGSFTLVNTVTDKFYGGRNLQYLTFDGISTGGIDGRGTFLFKQTGDFTGQSVGLDNSDLNLPSSSTGNIVIIGPSANLYRSGYRNPFQWGYLQSIGGIYTPVEWVLKVAGSVGTAIAIVPDQQLLKLDMEFPALCVTYSLQTAATDVFNSTQRQVSKLYSITSHFSQFVAISKGKQVLWGMDFKNKAIIESDGYSQVPVSGPISILLRQLTSNRSLQLLSHGLYDPQTECNLIWLSTSAVDGVGAPTSFDLCIYNHAPTDFWGVLQDYAILSSAAIEDANSSERKILLGTENGYLGQAFDPVTYGNWLPANSLTSGFINLASINSIRRSEGQDDFDLTRFGMIGNYCLVVDNQGLNPQLMRISAVTFDTLTFSSNFKIIPTVSDDTGLVPGQWQFFIGLIELSVLKYFDNGEPSTDKAPSEYWATLSNAGQPLLQYFSEHSNQSSNSILLQQDDALDAWFTKMELPSTKVKTFGLRLIERSYLPTKFYNFTLTSGKDGK